MCLQTLNEYGIKVHDAVVLLNREQGGTEQLQREGITLHRYVEIIVLGDQDRVSNFSRLYL